MKHTTSYLCPAPSPLHVAGFFATLCVASAVLTGHASGEDDTYKEPNFNQKLFDRSELSLHDSDCVGLSAALVAVAANLDDGPDVTSVLRARALVLAKNLDWDNEKVFETNSYLKRALYAPEVEVDESLSTKKGLSDFLWAPAQQVILSDRSTADDLTAAACLTDIALALDPENVVKQEGASTLGKSGGKAPWDQIYSGEGFGASSPVGLGLESSSLQAIQLRHFRRGPSGGKLSQITANGEDNTRSGMFDLTLWTAAENLEEPVVKVLEGRAEPRGGLPKDVEIFVQPRGIFEPSDSKAAGLACTLLAESILIGTELDSTAVVCSRIEPDGKTAPVAQLGNRLRKAEADGAGVTIVSTGELKAVEDLGILEDFDLLAKFQLIGVRNVEEAMGFAVSERDPKIQGAIDDFAALQKAMGEGETMKILGAATVKKRLQAILQTIPTHLSARTLLKAAAGPVDGNLTWQGSADGISEIAEQLDKVIRGARSEQAMKDAVEKSADIASRLRRLRSKIDPGVKPFGDTVSNFADSVTAFMKGGESSSPRGRMLRDKMDGNWNQVETMVADIRRKMKQR